MSNTSSSSLPVLIKDVIHKIQLNLLDGIKSETQLFVASSLLSKSDYHDVVTERSIAQMCGYPLCNNSLPTTPPSEPNKKGRYKISLKEHKVYDLLETRMYCSTNCVVNSKAYHESLQDERSLDLDRGKIDKAVKMFEGLNWKDEIGLKENGDFGLNNLSIKEKDDESVGIVSVEEWVGPSNAIEGYVPQHHRKKPGSKLKGSKLKTSEESIFNEMDFMSTIITRDDGYSNSKKPSCQNKKNTNREGTNENSIISNGSSHNPQNGPKTKLNNKESEFVTNQEGVKSSLKTSGAIRSVTWADEKTDGVADNRTLPELVKIENENVKEKEREKNNSFGIINESITDDEYDDVRIASAEAFAEALGKAAEAVASGESDAVSEAGLVILPPPFESNEPVSEGTIDPEPARLKWPKKTGITESDFLDSEDSWFDSPPQEFVVDLSAFATMFMSLFAWVSSSTLSYIYGQDDIFHEDYSSINGKEFPPKIILSDGRSSEIKQTLASCLSRALPGVIHDLRIPTPVSTIEYGMGYMLETMSFIDPLPGLRIKQWKVFVFIFIEAVSVSRIPAIASHLTNRRNFFQKIFDDGRISRDEYEVLKDLILPLGRLPQFAPLSGA